MRNPFPRLSIFELTMVLWWVTLVTFLAIHFIAPFPPTIVIT